MKASLLTIKNRTFLLPGTHDYDCPTHIRKYKDKLKALVDASNDSNAIIAAMTSIVPIKTEMQEILNQLHDFKEKTGIIGYPFTMSDGRLYAIDKNIDIVFELNIDDL